MAGKFLCEQEIVNKKIFTIICSQKQAPRCSKAYLGGILIKEDGMHENVAPPGLSSNLKPIWLLLICRPAGA